MEQRQKKAEGSDVLVSTTEMANGCAELYQTFLLQSLETGSVLVHTCHPRTFKAEEGES